MNDYTDGPSREPMRSRRGTTRENQPKGHGHDSRHKRARNISIRRSRKSKPH